jgi:hypothetical protein
MDLLLLLILIAVGGLPLLVFAGLAVLLMPVVGFVFLLAAGGLYALGSWLPALSSSCSLALFCIMPFSMDVRR